jgi:hypothetical protein
MTNTTTNGCMTLEQLLAEAYRLDDLFQAAVVKQFGKKRAGDMRYAGSEHNEATRQAGTAYWNAINAYLDAKKAAEVVSYEEGGSR